MTSVKSILKDFLTEIDDIKIEADVIVTATVLGFIGTRYLQGQPCSFDIEHPAPSDLQKWQKEAQKLEEHPKYMEYIKDTKIFLQVLDAMSTVLNRINPNIGKHLDDSQSPEWEKGATITGLKGGAGVDFSKRHRNIESRTASDWLQKIAENPEQYEFLYQGRGAYTGMIEDLVTDKWLVRPTRRVIDYDWNRWHPGNGHRNSHRWGLISPEGAEEVNLNEDRKIGMGRLPINNLNSSQRIGYIHGMSSAICECIKHGPWCNPFEMATGKVTTKMASCFACCTYMYAAGYPPSSMHLGRGESWVPPSLDTQFDGEFTKEYNKQGNVAIGGFKGLKQEFDRPEIVSSVLTRWHREVFGYMTLGAKFLLKASTTLIESKHYETAKLLDEKLKRLKENQAYSHDISKRGGNLFLDALTVHDSDWKRIKRTLEPAYDKAKAHTALVESRIKGHDERSDIILNPQKSKKRKERFLNPFSNMFAKQLDYSTAHTTTSLPKMTSTDEPVLLNGMKVIFNESASVYPVNLTQDD